MQPRLIVIGTSLGGLNALRTVLSALPSAYPLPVAVVQHRGLYEVDRLDRALSGASPLPIVDAEDKDPIGPGRVTLAPAGYHLLVDGEGYALTTEGPVNHSRPSIDVLFESAAETMGDGLIAVVLTGTGEDGAEGARRVKERRGVVVVEDPDTAEAGAMPAAARPWADHVLPLERIGGFLVCLAPPGGKP